MSSAQNIHKGVVSVVVPNYNYGHFLENCLESVLSQTYPHWELIVVDDNSTDNSCDIVKAYINRYPERNIKLLHNLSGPSGTPTPVNMGIRVMSGEYFAWLSSDDVFKPEKLELQVNMLEKQRSLALVFTEFDIIDEKGKLVAEHRQDYSKHNRAEILSKLLEKTIINGNTVLIRREVFETLGLFEERWEHNPRIWMTAEYLKWLQIALEYNIGFIKESVHLTRKHSENVNYYVSGLSDALKGVVVESFLSKVNPKMLAEKTSVASNVNRVTEMETKIQNILNAYGKHAAAYSRLFLMRQEMPEIFGRVYKNIQRINQLHIVANVARFLILNNGNYAEILDYAIPSDVLGFGNNHDIYAIASVLKKAGNIAEAYRMFEFLLQNNGDDDLKFRAGLFFHQAELLMYQNKREEARELFEQCLLCEPNHNKCKEYLNQSAYVARGVE